MARDIVAYLARRRLEGRVAEARGRGDSIARKHNRHGLLKIIGSGLPDANLGEFSSVKIADAVPINNFLPKLKKRNRVSRELLRPLPLARLRRTTAINAASPIPASISDDG
jgi:hypothetical protein